MNDDTPLKGTAAGRKQPAKGGKAAIRRELLLDCSRDLFIEKGYAQTSIADITLRADVSIGSVYYHFPNKAEIFLELWNRYIHTQSIATKSAVAGLRALGVADGNQLFLGGARAYLVSAHEQSALVRMFYGSDVPADFSVGMRIGNQIDWIGQNKKLLRDEAMAAILTGSFSEVVRNVAAMEEVGKAEEFINSVISIFARLLVQEQKEEKT